MVGGDGCRGDSLAVGVHHEVVDAAGDEEVKGSKPDGRIDHLSSVADIVDDHFEGVHGHGQLEVEIVAAAGHEQLQSDHWRTKVAL